MKSKKEKSKTKDKRDELTDEEFLDFLESASIEECEEYLAKNAVEFDNDSYASPRTKEMKAEMEEELLKYERVAVSHWISMMEKSKDMSVLDQSDQDLLYKAKNIVGRSLQENT